MSTHRAQSKERRRTRYYVCITQAELEEELLLFRKCLAFQKALMRRRVRIVKKMQRGAHVEPGKLKPAKSYTITFKQGF